MEESWLLRAASYVELNPVKARMVEHAWDYPWSSAHAHLSGKDNLDLIKTEKLLNLVGDRKSYLLESQHQRIEEKETRTQGI
jgi:REP-associated tyrosine transposase